MSSSWSDALRGALTPRLALALAASAGLHVLMIGSLPEPGGSGAASSRGAMSVVLAEAAAGESPPPPKAAGRSLPAHARYYRRSELDVGPAIRTHVQPEYPSLAHVSGKVVVRLFIDERGTVEHVAVVRAKPPGYFEASARRAFLAARFTPGMKRGVPVKSQIVLEVDYTHSQ